MYLLVKLALLSNVERQRRLGPFGVTHGLEMVKAFAGTCSLISLKLTG